MIDPLDIATRLIAIPSLSGAEGDVADEIENLMRSAGFRQVWRDSLGSVIGIAGPDEGGPAVLFDGHMDVVPAVGSWTADPFRPVVTGGRLFGRGSTDMKAGLAAAICGVGAACASGLLRRPVALSATVLEETVEGVALGRVLDDLRPEAVVICEPSDLAVQIAQRGRAELIVTVTGTPAHAAYPERGKNPITLAAAGLVALERLAMPVDPDLGPAIIVATDVISQPWPSISLIPSGVQLRFDRRTLVGETRDSVIDGVASALKTIDAAAYDVSIAAAPFTSYTGVVLNSPRWLAAWRTDPGHWLARAASDAVRHVTGSARTGVYDFCTNGSESAGARGLPTIGLGPGLAADAHTPDESVSISQIRQAKEIYEHLAIGAAARPAGSESG